MSNPQENKHEEHAGKKDVTIIVNGQPRTVQKDELTFTEVVALAYENPPTGQNVLFTITYRRGRGAKPEGTLVEGGTALVKEGMIFNVTSTDRS